MKAVSSTSLTVARALLVLEAQHGQNSGRPDTVGTGASQGEAAAKVCEKLRAMLTTFAGAIGYHSLLSRALTLAQAHEPSLAGVHVLPDGSLTGLDTMAGDPGAAGPGQLLVGQLVDLLTVFIGEPLTHQLIRSVWPDAPSGAFHSETKDVQ